MEPRVCRELAKPPEMEYGASTKVGVFVRNMGGKIKQFEPEGDPSHGRRARPGKWGWDVSDEAESKGPSVCLASCLACLACAISMNPQRDRYQHVVQFDLLKFSKLAKGEICACYTPVADEVDPNPCHFELIDLNRSPEAVAFLLEHIEKKLMAPISCAEDVQRLREEYLGVFEFVSNIYPDEAARSISDLG